MRDVLEIEGQAGRLWIPAEIVEKVQFIEIAFITQADESTHAVAGVAGQPQGLNPHGPALGNKGHAATRSQGLVAVLHKNGVQTFSGNKNAQRVGA